jgi:hypothetical protein
VEQNLLSGGEESIFLVDARSGETMCQGGMPTSLFHLKSERVKTEDDLNGFHWTRTKRSVSYYGGSTVGYKMGT